MSRQFQLKHMGNFWNFQAGIRLIRTDAITVFMVMNRFKLTDHTKMTEGEFRRGYRILMKV